MVYSALPCKRQLTGQRLAVKYRLLRSRDSGLELTNSPGDQLGRVGDRYGCAFVRNSARRKTVRQAARFVEGNRGLCEPRGHNGSALGEARRNAGPPAFARKAWLRLCLD